LGEGITLKAVTAVDPSNSWASFSAKAACRRAVSVDYFSQTYVRQIEQYHGWGIPMLRHGAPDRTI
jgi:hypothetical protein